MAGTGRAGAEESGGARVRSPRAPAVAVVVPIYNEAAVVDALAWRLERLAAASEGVEIAVIDGGSGDGSMARLQARARSVRVLSAPRGRARQMNAGARATSAPVLIFLHADTSFTPAALLEVGRAVAGGAGFGCFRVAIDSSDPRLRFASALINLRSRVLCSATGDQAIFVRRDLFESVGGYRKIGLCEDLALIDRLRGRARFAVLGPPVRTSARRWQRAGVSRTFVRMWAIRTAYRLGVDPDRIARAYADVR